MEDKKRSTLVEMKDICKYFGKVRANYKVKFKVMQGEIYALLGENGAGKSTLMNMLSGLYYPDEGEIYIKEKKVNFKSPKDSIKAGIGMIYQHFKLVENLAAWQNIILGQESSLFINPKKELAKLTKINAKFGIHIDLKKKIYDMSVGEKQTVEILKVLYRGADILILDEPTAVLTPQEISKLFNVLRRMKDEGCAIIIITHKLSEVMEISDFVSVMRKGETVGSVKTSETSIEKLTAMMVGRHLDLAINREIVERKEVALRVKKINHKDSNGVYKLKDISFNLYRGEVLGVAGIAGSGQKELCEVIAGLLALESGQILFEGENLVSKSVREISEMGISMSFIPEDRLGMGLVGSMNMVDNIILKDYYKQKSFFLKKGEARDFSKKLIEQFDIKTPGIEHPVKQLSGGNIQKILLGREINSSPNLMITAYPTRGLDIHSSMLIYDIINKQKKKGLPILYIGEDLDVILELSDRIMVMHEGRIVKIVDPLEVTKEELGILMAE